jgi:hypothetical protein
VLSPRDGDETSTTAATEVTETSGTSGGYGSTDYGPAEPPPIELVPCELAAGADAPGPPQLISAEFIEGALVLQFSEPIVPPDDVDPARFRLSIATYYEAYDSYPARSYYADPNWFLCGHTDACLDEYVSVAEIGCLAEESGRRGAGLVRCPLGRRPRASHAGRRPIPKRRPADRDRLPVAVRLRPVLVATLATARDEKAVHRSSGGMKRPQTSASAGSQMSS